MCGSRSVCPTSHRMSPTWSWWKWWIGWTPWTDIFCWLTYFIDWNNAEGKASTQGDIFCQIPYTRCMEDYSSKCLLLWKGILKYQLTQTGERSDLAEEISHIQDCLPQLYYLQKRQNPSTIWMRTSRWNHWHLSKNVFHNYISWISKGDVLPHF